MAPLTMFSTSTEYVHVTWTATVTLDTQTVELAFLPTGTKPDVSTTWQAATWEGDANRVRTCAVLVGPNADVSLSAGTLDVYSRLHDSPEIPVRLSGQIKVT